MNIKDLKIGYHVYLKARPEDNIQREYGEIVSIDDTNVTVKVPTNKKDDDGLRDTPIEDIEEVFTGIADDTRTKGDWIKEANETLPKCKWFIVKYFGQPYYEFLLQLLELKDVKKFFAELSDVWFKLPDNQFNIIEKPEGWSEFLHLIEFENEQETDQIFKL